MKKLSLIPAAFLSVLALVSCGSSSSTLKLDDSANSTQAYTDWFSTVTYEEKAMNYDAVHDENDVETTSAHYEVFLPVQTELQSSLRLNTMNVGGYNKKSTVYANYGSTSDLSDSDYTKIINIILSDENLEKNLGYTPYTAQENEIEAPNGFVDAEKSQKTLAVVYMPVEVKYVQYQKDGSRFPTLVTYVIVPVYASLCLEDANGDYSDVVIQYMFKDSKIELTVKKGIIK